MLVKELGDYSVLYRIAGFCAEVKQLITVRSDLRKGILNTLHEAGIEIASPSIMLQRPLPGEQRIIPSNEHRFTDTSKDVDSRLPEEIIFDIAESAGNIEELNSRLVELKQKLKELEESKKGVDKSDWAKIERRIERIQALMQRITERINELQKNVES